MYDVCRLALLDADTNAWGWPAVAKREPKVHLQMEEPTTEVTAPPAATDSSPALVSACVRAVQGAAEALIAAEAELTRLDTVAGDGDCGHTHTKLANALIKVLQERDSDDTSLLSLLTEVEACVSWVGGGTSGVLYSLFTRAVRAHLSAITSNMSAMDVIAALEAGVQAIQK